MRSSHSRGSSAATATALISSANRPEKNRWLLRLVNILRSVLACGRRLGGIGVVIIGAFRLIGTTAGSRLARHERRQEITAIHRRREFAVREDEIRKLGRRHERGVRLDSLGNHVGAVIVL